MKPISLVDYIGLRVGVTYISDLKYLGSSERNRIVSVLQKVEPSEFSRREWHDAIEYITSTDCSFVSVDEAKDILIKRLI